MDRQIISEEDTLLWLSRGALKADTESEVIAAQDQALQTKYLLTKILQTETDSRCSLCKKVYETVEHIMTMSNIGKGTIRNGHERVCAQLRFNICKEIEVK
jgi:hypothetical protein